MVEKAGQHLRAIPTTSWLFWGVLTVVAFVFFVFSPLYYGDADIFYHLSGGEYIAREQEIPNTSYFSFLSPERHWNDYYWLFQLILYGIYAISTFKGLCAARALVFVSTVAIIFLFLFSGERQRKRLLWFSVLFTICFFLLIFRDLLLRPHCISYLFIPLFLYILEYRTDRVWCLPILGTLWVNIHGVEYPVMILILLAYLAEVFYTRIRQGNVREKEVRNRLVFLTLTMATVFVSPHGGELVTVPFQYTDMPPSTSANLPGSRSRIFLSFSSLPYGRKCRAWPISLFSSRERQCSRLSGEEK